MGLTVIPQRDSTELGQPLRARAEVVVTQQQVDLSLGSLIGWSADAD